MLVRKIRTAAARDTDCLDFLYSSFFRVFLLVVCNARERLLGFVGSRGRSADDVGVEAKRAVERKMFFGRLQGKFEPSLSVALSILCRFRLRAQQNSTDYQKRQRNAASLRPTDDLSANFQWLADFRMTSSSRIKYLVFTERYASRLGPKWRRYLGPAPVKRRPLLFPHHKCLRLIRLFAGGGGGITSTSGRR